MNLKHMTQKLIESGHTQGSLAKLLTARGTPCSQPTIGRILNGEVDPSYSIGCAIEKLYAEKVEAAA